MFKFSSGDRCMIKYAPEAYDELNGYVVKLTQASLYGGVETWYTEEDVIPSNFYIEPVPEAWLWKFGVGKEDV